jgi:hypothetical protein
MPDPVPKNPQPVGQTWLRHEIAPSTLPLGSESFIVAGARRTEVQGSSALEYYPRQYATDNTIIGHLRFALRHEPLDIGVLAATMKAIDPTVLEDWLRREPTGGFSRRAWFFFELFTGRTLDIPDARTGNYVGALDNRQRYADELGMGASSRLSRIRLGRLGSGGASGTRKKPPCPLRTEK